MVNFTSSFSTPFRLWAWLSLKACAMVALILYAGIGLGPDEAQYWTWSRSLDWGYYSKPPGIAWQIWMGSKAFGQTEWGVRSLSIVFAFFQAWAVYLLALRAGLRTQTAFWSGILMAFTPLGLLGSLFAVTDGGFILCWTGACIVVISALQQKRPPNPFFVGGWVLAGALFKWPIYLFWLFYLCCRHWYFREQKIVKMVQGVLFSLLGLLPSAGWNATHEWATFRHVSATLQGGSVHQAGGNLGAFLGSQAALISPILFILLLMSLWQWFRQRKQLSAPLFICGFITAAILGGMGVVSAFQKVQGNWILFVYPTGLVLLGWYAFEQLPKCIRWVKIGLGFSVILTMAVLFLPALYTNSELAPYAMGYRLNPLKHTMGWMNLQAALTKEGYRDDTHFLVSDKYQTTSILSFYGAGQKRAYFLDLHGTRKNQFSYWPSLQEEQQGKTGFFVWAENIPYLEREWEVKRDFYQTELQRYFEEVHFLGLVPLVYEGSRVAKAAAIYRCEGCKDVPVIGSMLY